MSKDTEEGRYLYIVDYEEDAERKRAEYLFNNWEKGSIDRPSGLVRIAEGVKRDELYERLVGKVPEDQVDIHRLQPVDTDVEPDSVTVEQRIDASVDAVETFLDYILSKKKAVLQSAARNEYEVYTKKGRAEVSYTLSEADDQIIVQVNINGYPPAPSFLAEFFETELIDYATSQSSNQQ
jgi:hypothetical protein